MNPVDLFKNTNFKATAEGSIKAYPSMFIYSKPIIIRIIIGIAICIGYIFIEQKYDVSIFFLIVLLLMVWLSIMQFKLQTQYIEYEIKGDKFICREGILIKHSSAVNIGRIQNASVTQTLFDQSIGIGTVIVNTDDSTMPVIHMAGMHKPDELRAAILEASELVRKTRGLYEFVRT